MCFLKSKETQQISPSINVLLFKLAKLDRNNNFESDTMEFLVPHLTDFGFGKQIGFRWIRIRNR